MIGAVVPSYNLTGIKGPLKFTPETLAGIFLGKITKWNDPELVKINPGAGLPDASIEVAHRADGSGTTYVWTDYLSKVSDEWAKSVGKGTAVKWPVGLGGKGNEGVAAIIKNTPELDRLRRTDLCAEERHAVRRGAEQGGQIHQGPTSRAQASLPPALRCPMTSGCRSPTPPRPHAYPISSFTWLLIPEKISDPVKKTAITNLLKWVLTTGQGMTSKLSYAPLPKVVVDRELKAISLIQ